MFFLRPVGSSIHSVHRQMWLRPDRPSRWSQDQRKRGTLDNNGRNTFQGSFPFPLLKVHLLICRILNLSNLGVLSRFIHRTLLHDVTSFIDVLIYDSFSRKRVPLATFGHIALSICLIDLIFSRPSHRTDFGYSYFSFSLYFVNT